MKIENNKYLQYDCYELKATSPNIKLPESNWEILGEFHIDVLGQIQYSKKKDGSYIWHLLKSKGCIPTDNNKFIILKKKSNE